MYVYMYRHTRRHTCSGSASTACTPSLIRRRALSRISFPKPPPLPPHPPTASPLGDEGFMDAQSERTRTNPPKILANCHATICRACREQRHLPPEKMSAFDRSRARLLNTASQNTTCIHTQIRLLLCTTFTTYTMHPHTNSSELTRCRTCLRAATAAGSTGCTGYTGSAGANLSMLRIAP